MSSFCKAWAMGTSERRNPPGGACISPVPAGLTLVAAPTIAGTLPAVIVLRHPAGHAAVTQQAHAAMCGQFARAWGNGPFGPLDPSDSIRLAAEQHELGMLEWDRAPAMDPATGLPVSVMGMDLATHLPLRLQGPERLRDRDPYAALLVSLHHASFYSRPPLVGRLRKGGRQINSYLERSAEFQRRLSEKLGVAPTEVERNWRLVRAWDGLSHSLLYERVPSTLDAVPVRDGKLTVLELDQGDEAFTLDPWPFESDRVVASAEASLLEGTFRDRETLLEGLARAPKVTLSYALVPR